MDDRRRNVGAAQDLYRRVCFFFGTVFHWITHVAILPIGPPDGDIALSIANKSGNNNRERYGLTNSHSSGPFTGIVRNHAWQKRDTVNHVLQKRGNAWNVPLQYATITSNSSVKKGENEYLLTIPSVPPQIPCLRELVIVDVGGQQQQFHINYPGVRLSVVENLIDTSSSRTYTEVHDERAFSINSSNAPGHDSTDDPRSLSTVPVEENRISSCYAAPGSHLDANQSNHDVTTDLGVSSSTKQNQDPVCSNTSPVAILDYVCIQPVIEPNGSNVVLGKGCFGEVSLVRYISVTGVVEFAAMKLFQHNDHLKIAEEALAMAHLSDIGYVPKIIGLVLVGPHLALVQEYVMNSITLFEVLQDSFFSKLTSSGWIELCYQLAEGLALIHNRNTLINDIKEDNILVDLTDNSLPVVKYIDMGNATINHPGNYSSGPEILSVYKHLAPEVIKTGITSYEADVFSLGRMYHRIALASNLPEIYNIAAVCTSDDPGNRPTAFTIQNALKTLIDEQRF